MLQEKEEQLLKVGSRVRIRRDEFEDWMEQRDLERSMQ